MEIADVAPEEKITHFLVDTAAWAPSMDDTRPWRFAASGSTVSLHADGDAGVEGRVALVGCGAALYTLRLAVSHLGRTPQVRTLPDPGQPGRVADVTVGPPGTASAEERRMYRQIRRRRCHRGGFRPGGLPIGLLQTLRGQAYAEGVSLRVIADPRVRSALGALTEAAEKMREQSPACAGEPASWAGASAGRTGTVVAERAQERTGARNEATGVVALLVTEEDGRADWLRAGQALQRVLLCAAEEDVSAAFHLEALEVPELREFIRTRFCDGAHPQMIMRLGSVPLQSPGARPSVTDLTRGAL